MAQSDCSGLGHCRAKGLIPGLAQWIKGSGSDPIPGLGTFTFCGVAIKRKNKIIIYSLTVPEPRNPKSICWEGLTPSRGSGGGSVLCLFLLPVATSIPALCLHHSNLCLQGHAVRTSVTGFRARLNNLISKPLTTSAKIPFKSNKVTFIG